MEAGRKVFLDLIEAFLDGPLRERWSFICQKSISRWTSLDPYEMWTKTKAGEANSHDFAGTRIDQLFDMYELQACRNESVCVICFGHAQPQMYEATLTEATVGDRAPFEGLVIYDPKELAFCFTHEGDVRVFESSIRRNKRVASIRSF